MKCKYEWERREDGHVTAQGCTASLKAAKRLPRRAGSVVEVYERDRKHPADSWLRWVIKPDGSVSRP
jgi:hypothetical protein